MFSSVAQAKLDYQQIKASYHKSYGYEKTQNYVDAIKALKLVYAHYPETYTVNLRLGYLYLLNKKYANSTEHYKKALKALPNAISPLLGEMSVAIAQQNYTQAENIGYKIIKDDLYNYYGNLKLAYVLRMQKKYETAQQLVFKMLTKYPEDTLYMIESANLYIMQKSYAYALEVYRNIVVLDPENVEANYYLSKYDKPTPGLKK